MIKDILATIGLLCVVCTGIIGLLAAFAPTEHIAMAEPLDPVERQREYAPEIAA